MAKRDPIVDKVNKARAGWQKELGKVRKAEEREAAKVARRDRARARGKTA